MKKLIFICFLAISNCLFAQPGVTINVLGSSSWNKSFSGLELTEAGNDYVGPFESVPNATYIKIATANQTIDYKVVIHREDSADWPTTLDLQIKRINSGNQSTDGLTFTSIPLYIDKDFYYTKGKDNTDEIQFRINGISVLLEAKVYQTTVVFTVMNK